MRVFWEAVGILGPVYRLASRGLDDRAIASELKETELRVHSCVTWLLRFLELPSRADLVAYAQTAPGAFLGRRKIA